jgi:hypothetical protein
MKRSRLIPVICVSTIILLPAAFGQGSLTPPGAPAPTMKTLDQIEARTPVDAAHTPGNAIAQFIITQPGSYYLTTNIVGVSGQRGIQIQTGNVTLDLNGFSMFGVSGVYQAIYLPFASTTTNVTVRNGIIIGWIQGIYCFGQNEIFEQLNVSQNLGDGIDCSDGTQITGCTVNGNGQSGIEVNGSACLVRDNNCAGNNTANNSAVAGIYILGSRNRIEANHITGSGSGAAGYGILVVNSSNYTNNIIVRNSVISGGANNYFANASQILGPLISGTASGIITNSNPWANFSF